MGWLGDVGVCGIRVRLVQTTKKMPEFSNPQVSLSPQRPDDKTFDPPRKTPKEKIQAKKWNDCRLLYLAVQKLVDRFMQIINA